MYTREISYGKKLKGVPKVIQYVDHIISPTSGNLYILYERIFGPTIWELLGHIKLENMSESLVQTEYSIPQPDLEDQFLPKDHGISKFMKNNKIVEGTHGGRVYCQRVSSEHIVTRYFFQLNSEKDT